MPVRLSAAGVEIVELEHRTEAGVTRAAVVPAWGANVVSFGYRERDWAGSVSVLEDVGLERVAHRPTSYGLPLLAPTPGRVGSNQSGRFSYCGRSWRIEPTRHGLVRQAVWKIEDLTESDVRCATFIEVARRGEADGGERFPFRFQAVHDVSLGERVLRSRVRLENHGEQVQPLNAGWHPYLRRPPGPCRVRIPASSLWVLDGETEPTPTGEIEPADGRRVSFGTARAIAEEEHWDDVFTNLRTDHGVASCWVEGREIVPLLDGRKHPMTVRRVVDVLAAPSEDGMSAVPHVQLYTPPGREAISIEPLSSVPDAINLAERGVPGTGLCEVTPGGSVAFEISLRLEKRGLSPN